MILIFIVLMSAAVCLARDGDARLGTQDASLPAQAAVPSTLATSDQDDSEPEEPDFAFITGGPYTQKKKSIQFIFPSQWGRRRSTVGGLPREHTQFGNLLRTEWGLTDRWELDLIFSTGGERERLAGSTIASSFSLADTVLGARYRLLQESSAPFTLATGPQFIVPSGSMVQGTGYDTFGYAWDLAAAKDWGGPVFLYTSLNYAFFPSVRDPAGGSGRDFNIQNLFWGSALVFRPLEKPRGTSHHDIHLFFEYGLGREQGLETTSGGTSKVTELVTLFSPGIRYGLLTRTKKLFEVGVAFPVGLNQNTPKWGVILQLQFEHLFGFEPK